jgi:outer membrane murein-binding lipoprotein Lpp
MRFTIALIALSLLSGCKGVTSNGDKVARIWQKVDDELILVKKYEKLAKQARESEPFSQAEQYSDEAAKAARRIDAAAQEAEQMQRADQLSDDAQSLLEMVKLF